MERFLTTYAEEMDKPIRGITVNALQALVAAPWPGNIRELKHQVRRLVYLCPAGVAIDSSMLSEGVLHPTPELEPDLQGPDTDLCLERRVAELERQLITVALARTRGNRSRAAKLLGISRNGLTLKLDRLGLLQ